MTGRALEAGGWFDTFSPLTGTKMPFCGSPLSSLLQALRSPELLVSVAQTLQSFPAPVRCPCQPQELGAIQSGSGVLRPELQGAPATRQGTQRRQGDLRWWNWGCSLQKVTRRVSPGGWRAYAPTSAACRVLDKKSLSWLDTSNSVLVLALQKSTLSGFPRSSGWCW